MKNFVTLLLTISIAAVITNCATKEDPTTKTPGFLPNYSQLKPVTSPEGTQIYSYIDPTVKRSNYTAAIIESVSLYQTATTDGVSREKIEDARIGIANGIKEIISKKINVTNNSGPGVIKISVAITGATLEGDGFKPRNLIPISAAIKLASMATNLDNKKPVLMVEIKMVDSQTGRLIKETVTTIRGENFRVSANTAEEFQKLAIKWVHEALKYSETQK